MSVVGWFFGGKKEPRPPPPPPPTPRVRKSLIDLICASAQSQHPHEFGGVLRAERGVVTELLMLPGTISGTSHAIFHFSMMPIDLSVKGTVHSHPGGDPRPSGADLELFRKYGSFHIIIAEPYTARTWRAYNGRGEPVKVHVVDE